MSIQKSRKRLAMLFLFALILSAPILATLRADCPNTTASSGVCTSSTSISCPQDNPTCTGAQRELRSGAFHCKTKNSSDKQCLDGGPIALCWQSYDCVLSGNGCVRETDVFQQELIATKTTASCN